VIVRWLVALLLAALPTPAEDTATRVHELLGRGEWRTALAQAERAAESAPDDVGARALLAEVLFRAGRLDRVETLLGPAASLPPRGLMTLGRLRQAQGRDEEAVGLFDAAVAAAPEDREILYAATEATATRQTAIERYERYLERSNGDRPERIESARGAIRVLRALGERKVWIRRARPERVELALERLWDPRTGAIQGFVVRGALGPGKPVPLLLDSGSGGLHVIERVARKHGFTPLSDASGFGGGGEQRHELTHGTFPTLELGGLRLDEVTATVRGGELDPTGRYHGILGLAAFEGYRVTLDLAQGRLALEPEPDDPTTPSSAAYWTVGGQWLTQVDLGGSEPALFLFDTGATSTIVDLGAASRLPQAILGPARGVTGFGGALSGARSISGITVSFQGTSTEGRTLAGVDLAQRSELSGIEVSGYLGLDLLNGTRIVIDTGRQRLRIEPSSPRGTKKRKR
jgi:tetratricopeptide (TPR) repeat protein